MRVTAFIAFFIGTSLRVFGFIQKYQKLEACLPACGRPAEGRAVELLMRLDSIRYLSSKVYVLSCNVIH